MPYKISRIVPNKQRCAFCHNKATLLCDMPVGEVVSSVNFQPRIQTCDKNLCEHCATRVGTFDFCPDCVMKIKTARKGVKEASEE